MTRASRPRRRADSIPGASARLEITTAMLARIRPAATESAIASKLEPLPERRIPRFFITSIIHHRDTETQRKSLKSEEMSEAECLPLRTENRELRTASRV